MVPVPVGIVLAAALRYFASRGRVATDLPMMIGLTVLLSFIGAALAPANLLTIAATVVTLIRVGFWVGRKVDLCPIEAAIVNATHATHAGQGGTGGVANLTATERMELMPLGRIYSIFS